MKIKNILCPTDFSDISNNAIPWAISLASTHHARLWLLHVVDQLHGIEQYQILTLTPQEIAETMLTRAKAELSKIAGKIKNDIKVEIAAKQGKAFVEIIKTAKEQDIDLIVIGSHGRTGLSNVLIGSVAEKVSRKAPCPVLIVRGKDNLFEMP
ncbi:MAG: universal stress protein [Proteobacteria bacterium]|nr:universal stress protein [Pseudomonadota bacterium]